MPSIGRSIAQQGEGVLLQAVHGSLQNRIQVLEVDFDRANDLPDDYETDVELEWSNPSNKNKNHADLLLPSSRSLRRWQ